MSAASEQNPNLEPILRQLDASKQGSQWQARCPAHDDRQASLSIASSLDGKILLKCFAGCTTESILAKLGRKMAELFPPKPPHEKRIIKAMYDYRDEQGQLLFQAVRYEPKSFSQRRPDGQGGWLYNLKETRRVLYQLPRLTAASIDTPIFLCEGEKDADRLNELGLVATTNPMGAGKWRREYSNFLKGRDVVILPDNDDPGRAHARQVANDLLQIARQVKILQLDGVPPKGDVCDWLAVDGHDVEKLCVLAENTPAQSSLLVMPAPPSEAPAAEPAKPATKASKKVDVIDLVTERASLFHDEDARHYASVRVKNGEIEHLETYPIASNNFRVWLAGLYFEATGSPLYGDTLKEAIATIQALAQYQGEERSVHLRLAEKDGRIYLDLADRQWRVVEISPDGWRVVPGPDAPVRFVRRAAMLPIPEPILGGKIDELRNYMNLGDDDTWCLIASWLTMTLHPTGPYPILSITGEQGSAKTSTCKMLRALVDPNRADLRAVPKDERDLMIAASNSWVIALDNLSGMTQETSDSLCRIATGAGFATRTLHTDSEETIFSIKRPILTNGIVDAAGYPDLLDRSVSVFLRAIPDERRREEHELWTGFNQAKPRILGALLSAVSHAMRNRDVVQLTRRPRMADFARWAVAAEQGLNFKEGAFFAAYDSNRQSTNEMALDTPLAEELRAFMETLTGPHWQGTASMLLKALNTMVMNRGELIKEKYGWPKSANALSGKLRRLAPNLRRVGLEIDSGRTNSGSKITISRTQ